MPAKAVARRAAVALLAALAVGPARGQVPQIPAVNTPGRGQQAQPMPPLLPGQFLPATPPPPGSVAPPPGPTTTGPATPGAAPVAPVQGEWMAQGNVELRAVDKVMARTTTITAKVGETVRFGPLSVAVRGCVVRPADRAPDAAAFLDISEAGRAPFFHGWMVLSLPQLALVEHPTHDIRLAACRP